jgi:murein DD-endopeptidase MepM/ murein hydrolase activator NlpD
MSRSAYHFNHEKLIYEKSDRKWKTKLLNFLLLFFVLLIISVIFNLLYLHSDYNLKYKKLIVEKNNYLNYCGLIFFKIDSLKSQLQTIIDKQSNIYRPIAELNPLDNSLIQAGFGGAAGSILNNNINNNIQSINKSIDELLRQIYIQSRTMDEVVDKVMEKKEYFERKPAILPIPINQLIRISDYFGWRKDPFTGQPAQHQGIDLCAVTGTPVYATAKGIVTISEYSFGGYGNLIEISHGFGYKTRYAHLNKIFVKENQKVERGQLIGLVGNTGRSTGEHLHYEVRIMDTPVNPLYYINDDINQQEYDEIVKNTNN